MTFSDDVFRILPAIVPPLEPTIKHARWNPDDCPTIYTSIERETAIAEVRNRLEEEPPRKNKPHNIHVLRVRIRRVLDLRPPPVLARLTKLVGPIHRDIEGGSQAIGGAAAWARYSGLLVPSARVDKGSNLVLFPDLIDAQGEDLAVVETSDIDLRRSAHLRLI